MGNLGRLLVGGNLGNLGRLLAGGGSSHESCVMGFHEADERVKIQAELRGFESVWATGREGTWPAGPKYEAHSKGKQQPQFSVFKALGRLVGGAEA